LNNSWYHAQPHLIIDVYSSLSSYKSLCRAILIQWAFHISKIVVILFSPKINFNRGNHCRLVEYFYKIYKYNTMYIVLKKLKSQKYWSCIVLVIFAHFKGIQYRLHGLFSILNPYTLPWRPPGDAENINECKIVAASFRIG
jgi:hypothetical protein